MRALYIGGVFCSLLLCINEGSLRAEESVDTIVEDVALYWSPVIEEPAVGRPSDVSQEQSDEVTPAQLLTPQRQPSMRVAQRDRRTSSARSSSGLSNVPFMIGDTGSGTCLSIGGLQTFSIDHPTLTCSRLNISENNTAVPIDRNYMSYRHFKNVTGVRVLTIFERDYNVDRYTIGTERTFCDGMGSIEVRLPLERRLTSNFTSIVNTVSADPPIIEPFRGGRQNELGNVSTIFKLLLAERSDYAVSIGLGVTAPTAPDFTYDYFLDNAFEFQLAPPPAAPLLLREFESFGLEFENETVFLAPFLSWLWQPHARFYHQGFLQIEVAANPTTVRARGLGQIDFIDFTDPNNPQFITLISAATPSAGVEGEYHTQTLMRLNLGCGYILKEDPYARCIKRLTSLFEIHYTTTLQDAKITTLPLDAVDLFGGQVPLGDFFSFGNFLNRTDIVNVVAGLTANIGTDGRTVVTNGLAFPVTSGAERAFDLEYNLQLQRLF